MLEDVLLESDIIEKISPQKTNSVLSFHPNFGAWWEKPLTDKLINDKIAKKEANFERYKFNTGLGQWLLIVIHGQQSSYALRDDYKLTFESNFEKIFVLDIAQIVVFQIK